MQTREGGPPSALAEIFVSLSFSSLLSSSLLIPPEGVVVGFQIFAWAPKKKIIKILGKKYNSDPHPLAPRGQFLGF